MYFFWGDVHAKEYEKTVKKNDNMGGGGVMFARTCLFRFALSICHNRRKNSYDMPVPITPIP